MRIKHSLMLLGGVILAGVILIGAFAWWVNGNVKDYNKEHANDVEVNPAVEYAEADLGGGSVEIGVGVNDEYVQEQIHGMSHQKVRAMDKRYSIEMTQAKLAVLSEQIDSFKDTLEGYDTYRAILDKWLAGDFSTADEDHNAIWYMQSGEIGEAHGVLSKAEEQDFIEENF